MSERYLAGMDVEVTVGEFRDTHERARSAKLKVQAGLVDLTTEQLKQLLADLVAGQQLSAAENGPDLMFSPSYGEEINMVRDAIKAP